MPTPLSLVNRALTEIAARQPITGTLPTFDNSAAGVAAGQLYQPAVETLLRQQDWEFSRATSSLTLIGAAVAYGWAWEYRYPTDCLKIRQIVPPVIDNNDPAPVVWNVGTRSIASVQTRVIWTSIVAGGIIYTSNATTEDEWDALFQEQFVRYLGSMLAMPVGGRPDFSRELLGQAGGLGGAGRDKDS